MPFLLAASAAPVLPISSTTVLTGLLAIITVLLGLAVWFLQREIKNNDEAHRDLGRRIGKVEDVVTQMLAGQARIEGLLEGLVGRSSGVVPAQPEGRRIRI